MTTQEVNAKLIGKEVEIIVTGLMVKGIVTEIYNDEYSKGIRVIHEPVQWGNDTYTKSLTTARKFDEMGSLKYAKLI